MTLDHYLMARLREPIGRLPVVSFRGTPGYVTQVRWANFPDGSLDIERCIVTIEWDTGEFSDQSVNDMTNVTMKFDS